MAMTTYSPCRFLCNLNDNILQESSRCHLFVPSLTYMMNITPMGRSTYKLGCRILPAHLSLLLRKALSLECQGISMKLLLKMESVLLLKSFVTTFYAKRWLHSLVCISHSQYLQ